MLLLLCIIDNGYFAREKNSNCFDCCPVSDNDYIDSDHNTVDSDHESIASSLESNHQPRLAVVSEIYIEMTSSRSCDSEANNISITSNNKSCISIRVSSSDIEKSSVNKSKVSFASDSKEKSKKRKKQSTKQGNKKSKSDSQSLSKKSQSKKR